MEALLDYMPLEIKVKISEYILFGDDSSLWMRFKRGVLCMQETRENYEKTKDIPALKQAMDYLKRRNELRYVSVVLTSVAHCNYIPEEDRERCHRNSFKCLAAVNNYFLCDSQEAILSDFEPKVAEIVKSFCQKYTCVSHVEAEMSISYLSICETNRMPIKIERIMYFTWKIGYSLKVIPLNSKHDDDLLPPVLSQREIDHTVDAFNFDEDTFYSYFERRM